MQYEVVISHSCAILLSKYTTMAMATLALISNECIQRRCVELTLCKQWVRLNAYALEFEGFIGVWSSMLCSRNFTLLCCLNTTYNTWYYNGDCACLFVKYMERYHVGTGRTERAFQLLCVCVCVCVCGYLNSFEGVTGVRNILRL